MPAAVTPFDGDGAIDKTSFRQNVERMLGHGATGLVVGGCTGEFWALSTEERCALFEAGVASVAGKGTVIAGTGAITVGETVKLTNAAKAAGCDGALILPPYFVKLTDDEIFAHFQAVDAAVSFPIVIYNIPGNAVNAITPDLAVRLAELDNVVAIKESSGDWNNFYATLISVVKKIRVSAARPPFSACRPWRRVPMVSSIASPIYGRRAGWISSMPPKRAAWDKLTSFRRPAVG